MKIKYIRTTTLIPQLKTIEIGDWVDLCVAEDAILEPGEFRPVSLGIRMELPKGFEAWVLPRSSTGKKKKVLMYNSMGIIDEAYKGPKDIWHALFFAPNGATILCGSRVAQFRIAPKMNAGILPKLKWLFTKKVEFVEVSDFKADNRGGLGSTGD